MLVNVFMKTIILLSTVMTLMVNSWLIIWVLLEMNTMAFCSFMKSNMKKGKSDTDWMMKYFIIQSVSSMIMIFAATQFKTLSGIQGFFMFLLTVALLIKAAAAPFHQWFINMSKSMDWSNLYLLFTWQKLSPVYLMVFITKKILFVFIFVSMLMGATLQLNKKFLKEILGLSSVFNLSWMYLTILLDSKLFFLFTSVYWITVIFTVKVLDKTNLESLDENSVTYFKKWIYMFTMLNLAGIPPLINFVAKIMVLKESVSMSFLFLANVMLVISSINLYIYLRTINTILMKNSDNMQKQPKKSSQLYTVLALSMSLVPLTFLT